MPALTESACRNYLESTGATKAVAAAACSDRGMRHCLGALTSPITSLDDFGDLCCCYGFENESCQDAMARED